MNGVGLSRQQGGMGMPSSFGDELSPTGGGASKPPWTTFPTPPSSVFQKLFVDMAFGNHLKPDEEYMLPPNCSSLQSSFPGLSDLHRKPISCSDDVWIQQLQGGQQFSSMSPIEGRDAIKNCSQHIAFNGGSLVLDTARGELVNAAKMTPKEILEAKSLAASKSHSEAERRRRERINSHLATLRTLLPSTTKTDKASLLAEVIDQMKMLKRQVSEIYDLGPMPTDVDELMVEKDATSSDGLLLMKVSLCCDDRPGLMSDIMRALDSLGLRTLKAEISTLAGRVKNVFSTTLKDSTSNQEQGVPSVNSVQEALRQVIERSIGGESTSSPSKRQRVANIS
eukprot:c28831_g2_i1 orf=475-1488(-)